MAVMHTLTEDTPGHHLWPCAENASGLYILKLRKRLEVHGDAPQNGCDLMRACCRGQNHCHGLQGAGERKQDEYCKLPAELLDPHNKLCACKTAISVTLSV